MPAILQSFLLTLSVIGAYIWLQIPTLKYYSLQAFGVSVILYFAIKYFSKSKLWHIAPAAHSLEMVVATFAFLLLIGSTGNTQSLLFPLTYLHLFFLIFATHLSTSIYVSLLLIIFHYSLGDEFVKDLPHLSTIPVMLILFLFAKAQYQEVQLEKEIIQEEELDLKLSRNFLANFLMPKLTQIKNLTQNLDLNREAIIGQIMLIEIKIKQILQELNNND